MVTDRSVKDIPLPDAVKSDAGAHALPFHFNTWPDDVIIGDTASITSKYGPILVADAVISPVYKANDDVVAENGEGIKLEALNAVYVAAGAFINHGITGALYSFTKLSKSCSFLPILKFLYPNGSW